MGQKHQVIKDMRVEGGGGGERYLMILRLGLFLSILEMTNPGSLENLIFEMFISFRVVSITSKRDK